MKNQKGITLISLIITIIVMMILAGIALSFSVGENGVITKAEETKIVISTSEELERISLAILNAKTSNLSYLNRNLEFDEKFIKQVIEKEFGVGSCDVRKESDYFVVTMMDSNNKYKVTVDGKVEKITINDEKIEKFEITTDTQGVIFTQLDGITPGDPSNLKNGDKVICGDYRYIYQTSNQGWSVEVLDKTKEKYEKIAEEIYKKPTLSLNNTFNG